MALSLWQREPADPDPDRILTTAELLAICREEMAQCQRQQRPPITKAIPFKKVPEKDVRKEEPMTESTKRAPAWQTLYSRISELQLTTPGLTSQQAMTEVLRMDPDLAKEIRDLERKGHRPPSHLLPVQPIAIHPATQADAFNLAWQQIEKQAQAMVTRGDARTFAIAVDTVCQANPALYARYQRIRKGQAD